MDDTASPSSAARAPRQPPADSGSEGFSIPDGTWRASVAAILLLAAVLRLWGIDFGLPHLRSRPDEFSVVVHTAEPAVGDLDIDWAVYPHTYIYVSALWGMAGLEVARALGVETEASYPEAVKHDKATVILVIRTLSAVIGTLAVWLSILLCERVFGRGAALGAGLLVATCFLHARDSHVIKPDIFLSAAVLFAFLFIVPLAREATVRRGVAAGLAAGIAMAAKFPGVLLAAPVYLAAWLGAQERGWRRILTRPAIATAIAAAGFFVLSNPFVIFSERNIDLWQHLLSANFPQLASESASGDGAEREQRAEWVGSEERFEEMRRVGGLEGLDEREWWRGFAHHFGFSLRYGMGLLPTLLTPIALLWAVGFAPRRVRAFTWPAALFAIVYFVVFGMSPAMVARYMTPLIPLLLILEVGLLCDVLQRARERFDLGRTAALGIFSATALLLSAEGFASNVAHNRLAATTDTRVLATRWLAENTPRGSRVKDVGTIFMPYGRPHVPKGWRASKAPAEPAALAADDVAYVMTHDHVLFSSSVDPEAFARLEPHLQLLAEFDPYENAPSPPETAIFELVDPYYIPVHGFTALTRPGPLIRIYTFTPPE